jgi:mRNA interferase MazF
MSPMKRGDVWWVAFGPALGGEVRKERPAVIVSNDAANKHLNRLQVLPLTTAVDRVYPSEARVTVPGRRHKAMADQLTTVSKSGPGNRVSRLSKLDMNASAEQHADGRPSCGFFTSPSSASLAGRSTNSTR